MPHQTRRAGSRPCIAAGIVGPNVGGDGAGKTWGATIRVQLATLNAQQVETSVERRCEFRPVAGGAGRREEIIASSNRLLRITLLEVKIRVKGRKGHYSPHLTAEMARRGNQPAASLTAILGGTALQLANSRKRLAAVQLLTLVRNPLWQHKYHRMMLWFDVLDNIDVLGPVGHSGT